MEKIIKITFEKQDGVIYYLDDPKSITQITLALLGTKLPFKKTGSITSLRNKYFAMLTELTKHTQTGYTKEELHESLKPLLMKCFMDHPEYYTNNTTAYSVQHLNVAGLSALIEQLKSLANNIFGYVFSER